MESSLRRFSTPDSAASATLVFFSAGLAGAAVFVGRLVSEPLGLTSARARAWDRLLLVFPLDFFFFTRVVVVFASFLRRSSIRLTSSRVAAPLRRSKQTQTALARLPLSATRQREWNRCFRGSLRLQTCAFATTPLDETKKKRKTLFFFSIFPFIESVSQPVSDEADGQSSLTSQNQYMALYKHSLSRCR